MGLVLDSSKSVELARIWSSQFVVENHIESACRLCLFPPSVSRQILVFYAEPRELSFLEPLHPNVACGRAEEAQ